MVMFAAFRMVRLSVWKSEGRRVKWKVIRVWRGEDDMRQVKVMELESLLCCNTHQLKIYFSNIVREYLERQGLVHKHVGASHMLKNLPLHFSSTAINLILDLEHQTQNASSTSGCSSAEALIPSLSPDA